MVRKLNKKLIEIVRSKNREIIELKKEITRLRRELALDFSTGVLNRRQGLINLKREVEISKKYNKSLIIAFLDVDNLGDINDNFGHCKGDVLLNEAASIIKENIRKRDFVCRYGGDEFLVVFKDAQLSEAKKIWERVESKIQEKNNTKEYEFTISLSVGFAEYKSSISLNQCIKNADMNMYENKRIGKSS